jgi:hypothetical protein
MGYLPDDVYAAWCRRVEKENAAREAFMAERQAYFEGEAPVSAADFAAMQGRLDKAEREITRLRKGKEKGTA